MHYLVLFTITMVMGASYLVDLKVVPAVVKFVPEFCSAIAAMYVVAAGIRTRFERVRSVYWLLFGALLVVLLCGIVANSVGTGPIIAGLRYYLRAIPFFLLPAVREFRAREVKQQLGLLLIFAFLQIPISIYQRYALLQEGRFTGDYVFGTLMLSPTLTMFMLSCLAFITTMALRQRMGKAAFFSLFVLFLIPVSINETKVTVFLLPMVLFTVAMTAAERGKRMKVLGQSILTLTVAGAVFIPLYDYLGKQNVKDDETSKISDIFTKKDFLKRYLDSESDVGTKKQEVGRVDALVVPLRVISRDPVLLAFGHGLGDTSLSSLGSQFTGDRAALLSLYSSSTSAASFLLEIGILGILCVFTIHWFIYRDAVQVGQHSDGIVGTLALSWPAIVLLVTVTLFYTPSIYFESVTYLFWYFSGLILARRMQLSGSIAARRIHQSSNPRSLAGSTV